jgi:DNA-binding Lrp family transcriptional regulator
MVDIDLKDRKILYQLDLNCRQSNAQIGKKVGLSKQVVDYRIKRMEAEGIITGYWTAINTYKLGYYVFRIYINFIDVSSSVKNGIIKYFCDAKNTWAVITAKGPADLDVILWVNDIYNFNQQWEEILKKYAGFFSNAVVSILTEVISCKKSHLLLDKYDKDRKFYTTNCQGQPIKIDKIDYRLLDLIALDARSPIIDLAEKLNCSSQTINYHLKQLMQNDIIQAYRVNIDHTKLGFQSVAIDVYMKDPSKKKQIMDYVIQNPFMFDLMSKSIGWSDFTFQVMIDNMDKVFQIMDDLDRRFPDTVRKQNYWMAEKFHKERWLPEMTETDFKKQ